VTALAFKRFLRGIYYRLPTARWAASAALSRFPAPYKLNCGSGMAPLQGWVNLDVSFAAKADIRWDLQHVHYPVPTGSCSHIYCESLFQMLPPHLSYTFLDECKRMLAQNGTMRIAIPSLEEVVGLYLVGSSVSTQLINQAFDDNTCMYDWNELEKSITAAGFCEMKSAVWGQSGDPALRGLETRQESKLICEFKPGLGRPR
jgi:predicted SAM-dependent methyltransferase